MKFLRTLKQKINSWRLRRKAIRDLLKRYDYLLEVNNLMEEFDTEMILNANETQRRKDLLTVQEETKGMKAMIYFLRNLKR